MWKGRLLSMAGRICLLKTILNSLNLYFMSIFLMPKGVVQVIKSIQRRSLWARTSDTGRFAKCLGI